MTKKMCLFAWISMLVCCGKAPAFDVGSFRLTGNQGTVLDQEDFRDKQALFLYIDPERDVSPGELLRVQDVQTDTFKVLLLVKEGTSVRDQDSLQDYSLEVFQAPPGLFAGVRRLPGHAVLRANQLSPVTDGLPDMARLMDLAVRTVDDSDVQEQVTLLGRDGLLRQKHGNDCGPAAVYNLLQRMGIPIPSQDIYNALDKGPDGDLVSLLEIKHYLADVGYESHGWRGSFRDLRGLDGPAILQVVPRHFVVMTAASDQGILVLDPKLGRRFIQVDKLEKEWKGVYFRVENKK